MPVDERGQYFKKHSKFFTIQPGEETEVLKLIKVEEAVSKFGPTLNWTFEFADGTSKIFSNKSKSFTQGMKDIKLGDFIKITRSEEDEKGWTTFSIEKKQ